jgi:HlyD family secretion protein
MDLCGASCDGTGFATSRVTMIRDTSAQDRPLPARTPARRRMAWTAAAALLLAAAAALWPGLARQYGGGRSVSVQRLGLATVQRGPLVRDIAAEGRVVAAVSPTLYAANAGTVTLKVHAGDTVTRGQVLALIDSPELAARLAQERSNADALRSEWLRAQVDAKQQRALLQNSFENARIDLQTAQNDLARQSQAFAAGAAARIQVDQAQAALDKAKLTQAQAEAGLGLKDEAIGFELRSRQLAFERQLLQVKDIERQVAELAVKAPVAGQVGQLFVAERASVAKDAKLVSVIDLSALEVQVQVAESFARELAIGMPGEIAGNGKTWPGRISAVSPEVVNSEVAARLRFDGELPEQLRQNQRLSVRVLLDRRDNVLTVARGSFVEEGGGRQVYVLKDGIAEQRAVRLGARGLDKVEVLEGLVAGEQVVVAGADAFEGAALIAVAP